MSETLPGHLRAVDTAKDTNDSNNDSNNDNSDDHRHRFISIRIKIKPKVHLLRSLCLYVGPYVCISVPMFVLQCIAFGLRRSDVSIFFIYIYIYNIRYCYFIFRTLKIFQRRRTTDTMKARKRHKIIGNAPL